MVKCTVWDDGVRVVRVIGLCPELLEVPQGEVAFTTTLGVQCESSPRRQLTSACAASLLRRGRDGGHCSLCLGRGRWLRAVASQKVATENGRGRLVQLRAAAAPGRWKSAPNTSYA